MKELPRLSEISIAEFFCHTTKVGMAKMTRIRPFRNLSGDGAIFRLRNLSNTDLAT